MRSVCVVTHLPYTRSLQLLDSRAGTYAVSIGKNMYSGGSAPLECASDCDNRTGQLTITRSVKLNQHNALPGAQQEALMFERNADRGSDHGREKVFGTLFGTCGL